MIFLHHDFETRSILDLKKRGLDNYVKHPSTQILMMAWAINDDPVRLWEPHLEELPKEFLELLLDPAVVKVAWNSTFERLVWQHIFKRNIPTSQWLDPMIMARYMSLPGYLDKAGKALGVSELKIDLKHAADGTKIKKQNQLLMRFSLPVKIGKREAKKHADCEICRAGGVHFRDWTTHPDDWEQLREYCMMDVKSERRLMHRMMRYKLPEREVRTWMLDQQINDRGMPVNVIMMHNGIAMANEVKREHFEEMKLATGLENPNSVTHQLLPWLKEHGYKYGSLGKDWVKRALSETDLDAAGRHVLELRKKSSKASLKKLDALSNIVSDDSYLRHQFSFLGSSRAGRWSGRDVQLQNLPRPIKEVEEDEQMKKVIEIIEAGDLDRLKRDFKAAPLDIISSAIRSNFQAPAGSHFTVCDLNAIENRVLGWVARCDAILQVFRDGKDPYLAFGAYLFSQEYDELYKAYKAKDATAKERRQLAKPAVLGAGYGLGGGDLGKDKDGNIIKTGLWGYAEGMGVKMEKDEANRAVKVFRDSYPEVVQLWYDLENAAMEVLSNEPGLTVEVGPVRFQYNGQVMRIVLPSGRSLHYLNPDIVELEMKIKTKSGEEKTVLKNTITYDGIPHVGKGEKQVTKWGRVKTYGGKLTENIVQAISRDLLTHGMTKANEMGFDIRGHVHDEIIALTRDDSQLKLEHLRECMIDVPSWAPGLPLNAEGYEGVYYKKG